jgi:uncharacterized membrane protein
MDTDEIVGFIISHIKYIVSKLPNELIAENGEIQIDDLVATIGRNNKEYEQIIEIAQNNGINKISVSDKILFY